MVRTHKVVEKGLDVHVLFYVDGVQVAASVFPSTEQHDWDEFILASQLGEAWDSIQSK